MRPRQELLKDKHVLLIEDDEVNQMLLSFMIADQGAKMTLEPDSEKACDMLNTLKPDLILLDTSLENVNALELTRRLRHQMNVTVPIIGMSSVNLKGRGIYNGLDEVLLKPVEYNRFIRALKMVLK